MIALDDNGNFVFNSLGLLETSKNPEIQNAKCEVRCNQGEWETDPLYGKNLLIWELSSSPNDRASDLFRICSKYYQVRIVAWDATKEMFNIE